MNRRQSYEQLIADKLRQLHAPDADASWQQMKRLLDDDENTRVGGGRNRPPGNNGWWRLGIIVIVLSASFWLYVEKKTTFGTSLSKNNMAASPQAGNKTGEADNINTSNKIQTATIDNTTTLNDSHTSSTAVNDKGTGNATTDKSIAAATIKNNTNASGKTTASGNAGTTADEPATTANNVVNAAVPAKKAISKINNSIKHKRPAAENDISNNTKSNVTAGAIDADNHAAVATASNKRTHKAKQGSGKLAGNNIPDDDKTFITANDNNKTGGNNYSPVNQTISSKEKTWFERLTELKTASPSYSINTSLAAGDSIATSRDVSNILNNETKKGIAKAQRDNAIALLDKKDKKSFHLNLSNVFKPFSMHIDAEPWWAAGIALNSGIILNAQNRYNYNVNASSNIITDYIPSPYLQFHLNNYVYLQTELNFITPQYTPQLLAYRENNEIAAQAGMSRQKSIYIQKLYYFNWPFNLHYSPVSNLYFSAGIQFSSFQSGLAAIEEKQYATASGPDHAGSASTTVLKFKDDSIAAKIAPNEWRWQVDAEYYWNRFSVGLRYNQSFKNAINTKVSPALPPTVNRNESLLFFVRYNLFESRQKENAAPKNQ